MDTVCEAVYDQVIEMKAYAERRLVNCEDSGKVSDVGLAYQRRQINALTRLIRVIEDFSAERQCAEAAR